MKKRKIAFGPGASSLILIAVVMALSVLTVLTMMSARNDEALSIRSVETRQEIYALYAEGEKDLARLDAVLAEAAAEADGEESYLSAVQDKLPESMRLKEKEVSWEEKSADGRILECAVRLNAPGESPRFVWTAHRLGEADIWEDDFGGFDDFDDSEWDEDGANIEEDEAETGDEAEDGWDVSGNEETDEEGKNA